MSITPDWALPLCPNCGSWGQGTPVEVLDAQCRAATAFLIAHGIESQSDIVRMMRTSTDFGREHPVADTFPEPINWEKAAEAMEHYPNDEVRDWVRRQAAEYKRGAQEFI